MDTLDIAAPATRTTLKADCLRKDLHEGVQAVGHAVSGRSSLPILSHILIKSGENCLELLASDTELSMSLSIPATILQSGNLTVPGKLLAELTGSLGDNNISVSVDLSHSIRVVSGKSDYKLLGLPAEDYPSIPTVRDDNKFSVPQKLLKDMIRKTIFAVSTDEARAILTGVLMIQSEGTLKLVSTDTHRLAMRSAPVGVYNGTCSVIVPSRTLNELSRLLSDAPGEVTVTATSNQIMFETPGSDTTRAVTLTSNLIQGQFPNFERVIPTTHTRLLTMQAEPFTRAVKRAAIVARNNAHRIVLRSEDDHLSITAESTMEGAAYEQVEAVMEGDPVEMAFNAKYMIDVLNVLDTEGLYLEMTDALKPGVLRPSVEKPEEEGSYLCILMPMQIV
ncbi:MAG: DNA polymerase III subunit beta [Chthonomonadales bacterium]